MCGIYGYTVADEFGEEARKDFTKLIKKVAYEMSFRGTDSWGWSAVFGKDRVAHLKGLGDCSRDQYGHPGALWKAAIGHTRFATVGAVTIENAHPFIRGKIHGAHNGSISNYDEIGKKLGVNFNVDSDALIRLLADEAEGLHEIEGYGAVTWIDESLALAFLCRMKHGELEVATCKHKKGGRLIIWASKLGNTIQHVRNSLKDITIKELPVLVEGTVYVVKDGQLRKTKRTISLRSTVSYGYRGWTNYEDGDTYGDWSRARSGYTLRKVDGSICEYRWDQRTGKYVETIIGPKAAENAAAVSTDSTSAGATGGTIADGDGRVVLPTMEEIMESKNKAWSKKDQEDLVPEDMRKQDVFTPYNWWDCFEKDGTLKLEVYHDHAVFYDRDAHEWWPWAPQGSPEDLLYPIFDEVSGEYIEHARMEEILEHNDSLDSADEGCLDDTGTE